MWASDKRTAHWCQTWHLRHIKTKGGEKTIINETKLSLFCRQQSGRMKGQRETSGESDEGPFKWDWRWKLSWLAGILTNALKNISEKAHFLLRRGLFFSAPTQPPSAVWKVFTTKQSKRIREQSFWNNLGLYLEEGNESTGTRGNQIIMKAN